MSNCLLVPSGPILARRVLTLKAGRYC